MNKQQAIVFFGIILAGLGISLFTLNRFGKKVEPDPQPQPLVSSDTTTPTPTPQPSTPQPAPAKTPEPAPAPTPPPAPAMKSYDSPDALMGALMEKIRNRDVAGFVELAGPEAISPAIRPQVESLLKDPTWSPHPEKPVSELAKTPDSVRWAIHLERAAGAAAPGAPTSNPTGTATSTDLYADLGSSLDKKVWEVKKIALPFDFAAKTGIAPGTAPMPPGEPKPGQPATPGATPTQPGNAPMPAPQMPVDGTDALTLAHAFSQAVVERNFDLARQLTDRERVTDERVAALMIAVEEGAFRLREDKPLVVTLARNDLTWVLTRVESGTAASEFALEMGKAGEGGDWKIHGLTFSKIIASLADQAGAGGVAYAPIVADPKGGDSLVLYFEFDAEGLSARSSRQLRIVAEILGRDASRKIEINGHADAMGTDGYNENLSNRRSASIREKLIEFGVAPNQIVTKAFGESAPRRPNFNPDGTDNPDNRSQNRRAEVYLDF